MTPQGAVILAARQDDARRTWVRLLSPELGVVELAAYGAKGSRKRFSGGLSPTMWGQGWGQRGSARGGSKLQLQGFEVDLEHLGLREDPLRFAAAAYACELGSALLVQGGQDGAMFAPLQQCLRAIARGEHAGGWLRYWEIALLSHQGWITSPGVCLQCEGDSPLALDFLEAAGQWRCVEHTESWAQSYRPDTVRALGNLHRAWIQEQSPVAWILDGRFPKLAPPVRAELRQWCWRWIDTQLPRPLKSRAILLDLAR